MDSTKTGCTAGSCPAGGAFVARFLLTAFLAAALTGCSTTPADRTAHRRRPGEPLHPPPVPAHIPMPKEPQMGWPEAQVVRQDGSTVAPRNNFGVFERIDVEAGETLAIRVQWPRPILERLVAAEVNAAGHLDGQQTSRLLRLDAGGSISFEYTASDRPGPCQVVLRSGSDESRLSFWVPSSKSDE